jgi:predicted aldo/keto reductase-like oxidoreductase
MLSASFHSLRKEMENTMKDYYLGSDIKKLGFGLMRLPLKEKQADLAHTNKMVDAFIEKGYTYFDTGYTYMSGRSESILKQCVLDRYQREDVVVTTKLPLWELRTNEDAEKLFNTQLARTNAGFFDFYLLHNYTGANREAADKHGAWELVNKKKQTGEIKHLGISFHGSAKELDDILKQYGEIEVVQLQINYADWENDTIQSRLCYEVCMKHQRPVIIMEPIKGGSLANPPEQVKALLEKENPGASYASWALRFAATLPGLVTVLSGMSNIEQMNENADMFAHFKPLSDRERAVLKEAVDILNSIDQIPCTGCGYCVDDCPSNIDIPELLSTYNQSLIYTKNESIMSHYEWVTREGGKASSCIACGSCEKQCPQHIEIISSMQTIADMFG